MNNKSVLVSFLLIMTLTLAGFTQSSSPKTDSLLILVGKAAKKDQARLLNELSESYLPASPDKCITYANKALDIAEKQKDQTQTGISYKNSGAGYATLYQYDKALENYTLSIQCFIKTGNQSQVAAVLINKGLVFREKNNYEGAMDHFTRAMTIYRSVNDLSGEAKVRTMLGSLALKKSNFQVALQNYKEGLVIRQKLKVPEDIAVSLSYVAQVYKEINQFDTSVLYYQKVLDIRLKSKNKGLLANTLNDIGGVYWSKHDYEKAFEFYFRSIKIRYEAGDKTEIANSYQNIGTLFSNLGNSNKAREYYQQALAIYIESDDKRKIASTVTLLGNIEYKMHNFQEALNYFNLALNYRKSIGEKKEISISLNSLGNVYSELNNEANAVKYFTDALTMRREIKDYNGEIITLIGLGNLYQKSGVTLKALSYFESANKRSNETGNTLYIGLSARKMAEELLVQNHTENVEALLNISLEAGRKTNNPELHKLAHYTLYLLYKKKGYFEKAMNEYVTYSKVKDSLQIAQNSLQMMSVQQNLELEKKNNEIKVIEGQIDILKEKTEKQATRLIKEKIILIFLILFICFLFIIAGLIYNRYKIRRKNNQLLQEQFAQLEIANVQLKQNEGDLNKLNATKDKYFAIIAHDIKNPLSALLNFSHIIVEKYDSLKDSEIKDFNRHINESAYNINILLENLLSWARANTNRIKLQPVQIKLLPVVKSMCLLHDLRAHQKKISIKIEVSPEIQVFADMQMISLILRNLISNAVKFTPNGGSVCIKAIETIRRVEISIIDSGVGIKPSDLEKLFRIDSGFTTLGTNDERGSGLGLLLVKEFVEKNNGQVYVSSIPGKGSTFTFSLPNYV